MNKSSKILLLFILSLITLTVAASYYRFMIANDYVIEAEVDCDPGAESCFVWQCDPEVEGECTGDPESDTWYYKIAYRNAQYIPECDPESEVCEPFACDPATEEDCAEVLCDAESLTVYSASKSCVDLSTFTDAATDYEVETEPQADIASDDFE